MVKIGTTYNTKMDITRSDDALRFDRGQFWHQETLLYDPAVADFMDNFFDHYHLSGTGCIWGCLKVFFENFLS